MKATEATRNWAGGLIQGWDRFWFTPAEPHTLAAIRILAGTMLLYTHFVWSLDLAAFLGPNSWITSDLSMRMQEQAHTWSYLWYVKSPSLLWTLHVAALIVFAMFTLGLFTRVTSVLAWLITVSYCHRLSGALFGLDQVNAMLAMYLMIGPSGAVWSIDNWWKSRKQSGRSEPTEFIGANIAIRLIQLHMCVIYLFGGIGKMRGELWWDGSATWYSIANLEYQSLDMTWLVHYPLLIAFMTHVTVLWETFYCFLVWPKATRPIALSIAVFVHGGIALFLGMITFGLVMLFGNLAFVSPTLVRSVVHRTGRLIGGAGQAAKKEEPAITPRRKRRHAK